MKKHDFRFLLYWYLYLVVVQTSLYTYIYTRIRDNFFIQHFIMFCHLKKKAFFCCRCGWMKMLSFMILQKFDRSSRRNRLRYDFSWVQFSLLSGQHLERSRNNASGKAEEARLRKKAVMAGVQLNAKKKHAENRERWRIAELYCVLVDLSECTTEFWGRVSGIARVWSYLVEV